MTDLGLAFFMSVWMMARGNPIGRRVPTHEPGPSLLLSETRLRFGFKKRPSKSKDKEMFLALANLGPSIGVNAIYTRVSSRFTVPVSS